HRARPGDAALALARRRAHGQPRFGAKIRDPRPPSPHESRAGRHRRDGDPRTRDGRAGGAADRLSRRPRGKRREASAAGGADGVILSILAMAFREIRRHKMRSALTTLGIVIGVGSVVALVTVGEASSAKVRADMAAMGNNLLQVFPGSARRGPVRTLARPFQEEDALAIRREVGSLALVAPLATHSGVAVAGNSNHFTNVWGTTEDYVEARGFRIGRGRVFRDSEQGVAVCVLGNTVRDKLFGDRDPIGENVRIGSLSCQVIGTLQAKGANAWGSDQDDFILMPLRTVQRRLKGSRDVNSILVSVSRESAVPR